MGLFYRETLENIRGSIKTLVTCSNLSVRTRYQMEIFGQVFDAVSYENGNTRGRLTLYCKGRKFPMDGLDGEPLQFCPQPPPHPTTIISC